MNPTEEFIDKFVAAVNNQIFIKAVLSKKSKPESDLDRIIIKPVKIKEQPMVQFVYRHTRRDVTKNYRNIESADILKDLLGNVFLNASLFTTQEDTVLKFNNKRESSLFVNKASLKAPQSDSVNQEKKRIIDFKNSEYLKALKITDFDGNIIHSMSQKFKQVDKFTEIIADCIKSHQHIANMQIADMGCEKGYLTFAVYDYLKNICGNNVNITGIEIRPELVDFCNRTAENCGFSGLKFITSDIEHYSPEKLNMLIALHACNTATDDALFLGISKGAEFIITAPCCHKQIRSQITYNKDNPLTPVLKYGILEERMAEMITDSIRALLLEYSGYKTKVFEFVEFDNTAKNLIITAVKTSTPNPQRKQKILDQIDSVKKMFGIKFHYLETLLFKENININ